jgi:hypothetical protein
MKGLETLEIEVLQALLAGHQRELAALSGMVASGKLDGLTMIRYEAAIKSNIVEIRAELGRRMARRKKPSAKPRSDWSIFTGNQGPQPAMRVVNRGKEIVRSKFTPRWFAAAATRNGNS